MVASVSVTTRCLSEWPQGGARGPLARPQGGGAHTVDALGVEGLVVLDAELGAGDGPAAAPAREALRVPLPVQRRRSPGPGLTTLP